MLKCSLWETNRDLKDTFIETLRLEFEKNYGWFLVETRKKLKIWLIISTDSFFLYAKVSEKEKIEQILSVVTHSKQFNLYFDVMAVYLAIQSLLCRVTSLGSLMKNSLTCACGKLFQIGPSIWRIGLIFISKNVSKFRHGPLDHLFFG